MKLPYSVVTLLLASCAQSKFSSTTKPQPAPEKTTAAEQVADTPAPQPMQTETATPPPVSKTIPAYGTCSAPCDGSTHTFKNEKYNKWVIEAAMGKITTHTSCWYECGIDFP